MFPFILYVRLFPTPKFYDSITKILPWLSWLLMAVFRGFWLLTMRISGLTFQNAGFTPGEKNLFGVVSISIVLQEGKEAT